MAKASPSQVVPSEQSPSTTPAASAAQAPSPAPPGPFMEGPQAPTPPATAAAPKLVRVLLKKQCGGAPSGTKPGDELARIEFVGATTMHFIADAFKDGFIKLVVAE